MEHFMMKSAVLSEVMPDFFTLVKKCSTITELITFLKVLNRMSSIFTTKRILNKNSWYSFFEQHLNNFNFLYGRYDKLN